MSKEEGKNKQLTINIGELFQLDPDKIKPDINHVHYSNIAYIQVNQRDVQIDFLQMPGIPDDGMSRVETTRIYLTHYAAQKLAETLISTLKNASDSGTLDLFKQE